MTGDKFFIEVDVARLSEKGQVVSGNVCLQRRHAGRTVVVLSDGGGSGVRANVTASVICSMAINYTISNESVDHAASTIIRAFAAHGAANGADATFSILDIHRAGEVRVVEFGNPQYILLSGDRIIENARKRVQVTTDSGVQSVYVSEFTAGSEDRIILVSDGVASSGRMTRRLPQGWGRVEVVEFCRDAVHCQTTISAHDLCRSVVNKAELNDLFAPKNDMTCAVIYFRQPRKIMVCSGPPFKEQKDEILADMVDKYEGTKLICGGTTAQIISRELRREITVQLKRDPAGLPPTSTMEGVDLITEGVLTLSKVAGLLEQSPSSEITREGTHGDVARMLLRHDIIEFVIGTRINPMHQDPNLPVELELRRNLIKELGRILETKYMKEVKIQYI